MLYTRVPLVSFGEAAVVTLWLIAGTLASMEEVVGLDKIPHDKSETKDAIASGDTDGKMPK